MRERADEAIVRYLSEHGYHPRSAKHGEALCDFLLEDLLRDCSEFASAARTGRISFERNFTVNPDSPEQWNTDLVIGPPRERTSVAVESMGPLVRSKPVDIWVAVDAKSIMTEHGKARRNRHRDLNSFQSILHRRDPRTIVAGIVLLNMAERFRTPLRHRSKGPNLHKNVARIVGETVAMLEGMPRAGAAGGTEGIDALGVIVVDHSNIRGERSRLIDAPPAPPTGHPLSYESFLRTVCEAFTRRYGEAAD